VNERLAVSVADLDDLDLDLLDAFIARRAPALLAVGSREEAAIRLGLLAKVAPRVVPTMVGLYLFGKLPQFVFPEWGLGCAAFAGTAIDSPVARRADAEGPLGALLEAGLAFVRSHSGTAEEPSASEYPEVVVREILTNALVHRDLRKPSRVLLRLFTDRLEVWSPGGPPEGVTDLEELARDGGLSQPKNPLLAASSRVLGMSEQLGRGLSLVLRTSTSGARIEIRTTPRDVLVIVPSRWQRPRAGEALS
jgi:predicted HTH transcriptional regulator